MKSSNGYDWRRRRDCDEKCTVPFVAPELESRDRYGSIILAERASLILDGDAHFSIKPQAPVLSELPGARFVTAEYSPGSASFSTNRFTHARVHP
jgi:hypothetical protein